jgi:hypothetical protein
MSEKQSCGTCKWLRVAPDKDGKIRVRKNLTYRCDCPVLLLSALPDCVTKAYDFYWPPHRIWISPNSGKTCPTFERKP